MLSLSAEDGCRSRRLLLVLEEANVCLCVGGHDTMNAVDTVVPAKRKRVERQANFIISAVYSVDKIR
jgi:hypothetical protein